MVCYFRGMQAFAVKGGGPGDLGTWEVGLLCWSFENRSLRLAEIYPDIPFFPLIFAFEVGWMEFMHCTTSPV